MQCIPICSALTDDKGGGGNVLVEIVGYSSELLAPGTFRGTKCVVPFSLPLKSKGDKNEDSLLLETYHGIRVKIVYNIKAGLKRRSRLQQMQLITGLFSVISKHARNLKRTNTSVQFQSMCVQVTAVLCLDELCFFSHWLGRECQLSKHSTAVTWTNFDLRYVFVLVRFLLFYTTLSLNRELCHL